LSFAAQFSEQKNASGQKLPKGVSDTNRINKLNLATRLSWHFAASDPQLCVPAFQRVCFYTAAWIFIRLI